MYVQITVINGKRFDIYFLPSQMFHLFLPFFCVSLKSNVQFGNVMNVTCNGMQVLFETNKTPIGTFGFQLEV